MVLMAVAQEPRAVNGRSGPPTLDLAAIQAMADGREKLTEILRFTRNPNNIDAQSESLLVQAIEFATVADEPDLLSGLLVNHALMFAYKRDNSEAARLLDRARDISSNLPVEQQLAALNGLAIGYRRINDLEKAIDAHERHNALTKGRTDRQMVMHRITNLQNEVNVYHMQRRYDLVRHKSEEVKQLLTWIDDPRIILTLRSIWQECSSTSMTLKRQRLC